MIAYLKYMGNSFMLPVLLLWYLIRKEEGFPASLLGKYWEVAHTPIVKFLARTTWFLLFIVLLAVVVSRRSDEVPSWIEAALAVWVAGLILEEVREMRTMSIRCKQRERGWKSVMLKISLELR